MKKSFLFISCEEAFHICDKSQYGEATGWEKIKLAIRLSWCKVSRAYSSNNKKLTESIQKADVVWINEKEREALQKQFDEELVKYQGS